MAKLKAYRQENTCGWVREDFLAADNTKVFARPDKLLKDSVMFFKKETDKVTLLVESPINGQTGFWLIKAGKVKSDFISKWILLWKNKKRLITINKLRSKGLPVPDFYAWLWQKNQAQHCYSISEGFFEGKNLALIAREQKKLFRQLVEQGFIFRLVEVLADLHKYGYSHGDIKWSNIVLLHDQCFRFVDLDHVKKPIFGQRQRSYFKDLARFLISAFEAGLDEKQLTLLIEKYAASRSLNYNWVIKKISSHINKISIRKNIQGLDLSGSI